MENSGMRKQSNLVLTVISCIAVLLVVAFVTSNAALKDTYAADPLEGQNVTCVVRYDNCVTCGYTINLGDQETVEANVDVFVNGNPTPVSNPSAYIEATGWRSNGDGGHVIGFNSNLAHATATIYADGDAGEYIVGAYSVILKTGYECGRFEDGDQTFTLHVTGATSSSEYGECITVGADSISDYDSDKATALGLDSNKHYSIRKDRQAENGKYKFSDLVGVGEDGNLVEGATLHECDPNGGDNGSNGSDSGGSTGGAGCYKKDGVSKWYTRNPGSGYAKDGDNCYVCYTCEAEDNSIKYCWSYPDGADANCTKNNLNKAQCTDTSFGYLYCFQCTVKGEAVFEIAKSAEDAAKAVNGTDCELVKAANCKRGCYGCTANGSTIYTSASSVSSAAVLTGGTNCQEVSASYCSTNTDDNPKTGGTLAIVFAWLIAAAAVGYTFWYFKRSDDLSKK